MAQIKILVIEDENIVALDLKNQLETLGYEVCAMISNGEEAIERVGELKPDLILMDIMLKGELDGVQTAEKIKESHNIPIIYLTAYSDEKTLKRAKITEPYGYLLKPFEERELHTNIEIGLYRHKAEQRIQHLAYYDQLTDLPNRVYFFEEFKKALKQAKENNTKVGLLFLDLYNFKI
jgi:PleD family two-component response regulator